MSPGVTRAIRGKLNFYDDRQWKRFSARRLELIDTLELSSRKASEQERDIRRVSETLRAEFQYDESYADDFDKLVRAAVQSVRRNRKRSHKRVEQVSPVNQTHKRVKMLSSCGSGSGSEESSSVSSSSEFLRHEDEVYDVNYEKTKRYSSTDYARDMITIMTKPRLPSLCSMISSPKQQQQQQRQRQQPPPPPAPPSQQQVACDAAKKNILNKIERSRTCNETLTERRTHSLKCLGKSCMASFIDYTFETSFAHVNEQSVEYLRGKLNQEASLAKIFRELDSMQTPPLAMSDETAVISLFTLVGGMVKDFGFDDVVHPICEILHASIVRDYPLISKLAAPVATKRAEASSSQGGSPSLSQLADVATILQNRADDKSTPPLLPSLNNTTNRHTSAARSPPRQTHALVPLPPQSGAKKKVILQFLHQTMEMMYPALSSAAPRYCELIENVKAAFHLHDVVMVEVRYQNQAVQTDAELEKILNGCQSVIKLDVSTQISIPIRKLSASTLAGAGKHHLEKSPREISGRSVSGLGLSHSTGRILLPPVSDTAAISVGLNRLEFGNSRNSGSSQYLSRPSFPKFEPLL
ncbi:uncharacterized protein LODBEIA_P05670 [Lodderomyces beijingensis]|uniref:Transcription factor VHR1 n=1 Tax=Lodderomyces beijingensis TaxID=1775926 RepID=A0ABP0ZDU8_9ASCO